MTVAKVLPKPDSGEDREVFVSRCLSDEEVQSEFVDEDQRVAVCHRLFEGKGIYGDDDEDNKPGKKPKDKTEGAPMERTAFMVGKRKIDPEARQTYINRNPKLRSSAVDLAGKVEPNPADDPGFVEGFAAVFGNIDLQDEMIRKGAFSKTLNEVVPQGKVKLMLTHFAHGGDITDMIGTITEMREDEFGLFFHAEFDEDELSQKIRKKVVQGKIRASSIGFKMIRWDFVAMENRTILEHIEAKVLEVTLTLMPANPLAMLTGAKSVEAIDWSIKDLLGVFHLPKEDLTPEVAGKLLDEYAGGLSEAKAFCDGTEGLVGAMRGLIEVASQDTETEAGSSDEDGDESSKADAATLVEANLHSMDEEIKQRRMFLDSL